MMGTAASLTSKRRIQPTDADLPNPPAGASRGAPREGAISLTLEDGPTETFHYTDKAFWQRVEKQPGVTLPILKARRFRKPLTVILGLVSHHVVVVETAAGFWSLEKDYHGVTVQYSAGLARVRDRCRGRDRLSKEGVALGWRVREVAAATAGSGQLSVKSLLLWLLRTDLPGDPYHLLADNCHRFADTIYSKVTQEGGQ